MQEGHEGSNGLRKTYRNIKINKGKATKDLR